MNCTSDEVLISVNTISYLDSLGIMENIKKRLFVNQIRNNICPIYNVSILIDIRKCMEVSEILANAILQEPFKMLNTFHDIVLFTIQKFIDNKTTRNQVNILIKSEPIPVYEEFNNFFNKPKIVRLVSIKAIFVQKCNEKYIRTSIWLCKKNCETNKPIAMNGILPNEFLCEYCLNPMIQQTAISDVAEKIQLKIMSPNSYRNQEMKYFYESLPAIFKNDLDYDIELGIDYMVTGVLNTNGLFHIYGCKKEITTITPHISNIPQSVLFLWEKFTDSPFKFVYILASQLGTHSNLYPPDTFWHLKMGLLLSLASFKLNEESETPIPIIAIGADTYSAHRLLYLASKLASRHMYVTANEGTFEDTITKDESHQAGIFTLTKSGVTFLGDWTNYVKGKSGLVVKTAIESGKIPVNYQNGKIGDISVPLTSAIWTYWYYESKPKDHTELKTLINLFGLPFLSDPGFQMDSVISHILESAQNIKANRRNQCEINESDITMYLNYVNSKQISVTSTAEEMIKSYFIVSRKVQPGSLSVRALKSLLDLAEAHAKLAMHSEVKETDALVAICLCEQVIQTLYGEGSFSAPPQFSGGDIDVYMREFNIWLHDYTNNFNVLFNDIHSQSIFDVSVLTINN